MKVEAPTQTANQNLPALSTPLFVPTMRIFAGPNGSGKSTIVEQVKNMPTDLGVYINADDITLALCEKRFTFSSYSIKANRDEFIRTALASGLINKSFPKKKEFLNSFYWIEGTITLQHPKYSAKLAQIIADFLRTVNSLRINENCMVM